MPHFSQRSMKNMKGIHPFLKALLHDAIADLDFTVVSGVRTTPEQQALYAKGRTEPGSVVTNIDGIDRRSNHQINPETGFGHAVDLYPYPIDDLRALDGLEREKALRRFVGLAFFLKGRWEGLRDRGDVRGELRWGGDWDSDFDFTDQTFDDLPHIELVLD